MKPNQVSLAFSLLIFTPCVLILGTPAAAQEGNIWEAGHVDMALKVARDGYFIESVDGKDVHRKFTMEQRYQIAEDAANLLKWAQQAHPDFVKNVRRYDQDVATFKRLHNDLGTKLDNLGIPRPAPTPTRPPTGAQTPPKPEWRGPSFQSFNRDVNPPPRGSQTSPSANNRGDNSAGSGANDSRDTRNTRPTNTIDDGPRASRSTVDTRSQGASNDGTGAARDTQNTRLPGNNDDGPRANRSTVDTRSQAAEGGTGASRDTRNTRLPNAGDEGPRASRDTAATREPRISEGGARPGGTSSGELPLLNPNDPQSAPKIENGQVTATQQAGSASAEENVRHEFIVKKDGTVIPGRSNPVDMIGRGETVVQVNPLTGKRTFLHGPDVPNSHKEGIETRMTRELDTKIEKAVSDRRDQIKRVEAQTEAERVRVAGNAESTGTNRTTTDGGSARETMTEGSAKGTSADAPSKATIPDVPPSQENIAGKSSDTSSAKPDAGNVESARPGETGAASETASVRDTAKKILEPVVKAGKAAILEPVGEAGKGAAIPGGIIVLADAAARGMEAGVDGKEQDPLELAGEVVPELVEGGVVFTAKVGLGALGGAALGAAGGFIVSGGNPAGALAGAIKGGELGAGLVAGKELGDGALAAGERLGVAKARVDLAEEELDRNPTNLGEANETGNVGGSPLRGDQTGNVAPMPTVNPNAVVGGNSVTDEMARVRDDLLRQYPQLANASAEEQDQILRMLLGQNGSNQNEANPSFDLVIPEAPEPPEEVVPPPGGGTETKTELPPVEQEPELTEEQREEARRIEGLQPRERFEGGSLADFVDQVERGSSADNDRVRPAAPAGPGGSVDDFADPNAGTITATPATPGPANVSVFRPGGAQGAPRSTVDANAFNRGMNKIDAKVSFRIDGDYPQAARLTKALNDYRRAVEEMRRIQAERRRAHEIAEWQRRVYELQRQYLAQQQAYNNWLASQRRAPQPHYVPAAPAGGHQSGGLINDN